MSKLTLKRDGYVADILMWENENISLFGRDHDISRLEKKGGCAIFWLFVFAWLQSLGGLRRSPEPRSLVTNQRYERLADLLEKADDFLDRIFPAVIVMTAIGFMAFILLGGYLLGSVLVEEQAMNVFFSLLVIVGCITAFLVSSLLLKTEVVRLFGAWLVSIKNKTCPIITFE